MLPIDCLDLSLAIRAFLLLLNLSTYSSSFSSPFWQFPIDGTRFTYQQLVTLRNLRWVRQVVLASGVGSLSHRIEQQSHFIQSLSLTDTSRISLQKQLDLKQTTNKATKANRLHDNRHHGKRIFFLRMKMCSLLTRRSRQTAPVTKVSTVSDRRNKMMKKENREWKRAKWAGTTRLKCRICH